MGGVYPVALNSFQLANFGERKSLMNKPLRLWPQEIVEADGTLTISAVIEHPHQEPICLWYRLPAEQRHLLTSSSDPFAIATVMLAMAQARDLVIYGPVSRSLLNNLEEFQTAWHAWYPQQLHPIEIQADTEIDALSTTQQAVVAFSGGVDSAFSAFRPRSPRSKYTLAAGLMIHGFDIPLREPDTFDRATQRSERMLRSLNLDCLSIATNFKEVIPGRWEDVFGVGAISCLAMLGGGFAAGLVASSYAYRALSFPYGSNPITDRLLSSDHFEIVHDGAGYSRFEKIQQLKHWPEALENLRVCWQGDQKDRNCGRCEKCVRNILNFRLAGMGLPPCFDQDVSDDQICRLRLRGGSLDSMTALLDFAMQQQPQASWVRALQTAVRRNQRINQAQRYLPQSWRSRLVPLKKWVLTS
jgi:hypothetical protein